MSAANYKHSYDEKKIAKYMIGEYVKENCMLNIQSEDFAKSYFNAIKNKAIFEPQENKKIFFVRINSIFANLMNKQ